MINERGQGGTVRIIVAGLGAIGVELVRNLTARGGFEIVALDVDEEPCKSVAEEFDVLVLRGDATDPEFLEKARIREASALVATTGSDALNTVIAMLGHRAGVPKVVVKLTGHGLRPACQEIGVHAIVAPTIAAAAQVEAALYGDVRPDLSPLLLRGLALGELEVAESLSVAELKLPKGAAAIAVRRGDDVFLPGDDTNLREGDVIFVLGETAEEVEKAREVLGAGEGSS